MTTEVNTNETLGCDVPPTERRTRKVSARILEAIEKVSMHIPAKKYKSNRKEQNGHSDEDSGQTSDKSRRVEFIGKFSAVWKIVLLIVVIVVIWILSVVAVSLAATQMNEMSNAAQKSSLNNDRVNSFNISLHNMLRDVQKAFKELADLREKQDPIAERVQKVQINFTQELPSIKHELVQVVGFAKYNIGIDKSWIFPINGYKYSFSQDVDSWDEIRGYCNKKGADLAGQRLSSLELRRVVCKKNPDSRESSIFIGLKKETDEIWKWVDGSSPTAEQLGDNAGKMLEKAGKQCAVLDCSNDKHVIDVITCTTARFGVCEMKAD